MALKQKLLKLLLDVGCAEVVLGERIKAHLSFLGCRKGNRVSEASQKRRSLLYKGLGELGYRNCDCT